MATMVKSVKRMTLRLESLLLWGGLAVLVLAFADFSQKWIGQLTMLDRKILVLLAAHLFLAGVVCRSWRNRENRQWLWFGYGAIAMLGFHFMAQLCVERFSDFYLSVWVELFKLGLI